MIKFACKNCGQRFKVSDIDAGRKGKCPKCKNIIVVPETESAHPTIKQREYTDLKINSSSSAYNSTFLDVPKKDRISSEQTSQYSDSNRAIEGKRELEQEPSAEEAEPSGKRKLPWIVDIFLYPMSIGGLTTLVVIIILKLLTDIAAVLLACCIFGGILGLIIRIVIVYSYMYWYFSECIRDSAAGGLRAPQTLASMPGLGDMFWQWARLFACYSFSLGPVTFYRGYTYFYSMQMNSIILWSLLTYGVFFFPIGILAVVMFDTVNGLNPILIIRSIISTFIQYCGLFVLFYGLSILFIILLVIIGSVLPRRGMFSHYLLSYILSNIAFIYALLIYGHLLGRFYWRYQEKLNWEV